MTFEAFLNKAAEWSNEGRISKKEVLAFIKMVQKGQRYGVGPELTTELILKTHTGQKIVGLVKEDLMEQDKKVGKWPTQEEIATNFLVGEGEEV